MPSQASRQAPGDPGRQKMKVAPATPAVARLWIVDVPISAWLTIRNSVAKPSMRFSNNGSSASGVTSRPVKPVPPVVMTTSMPVSAIHFRTTPRIASTSSVTISREASLWPAAVRRSTSVPPDLSSAAERVSEIVSTAMLSGMELLDSSIDAMMIPLQRIRAERIAGLDRALLIAGHEPALALRSRAMREGVRHNAACRLALQGVIADGGGRGQRRIDVPRLEEVRSFLLLAVDPDAGQTIRLQLDPHLERVRLGLARHLLLHLRHARDDAEQVLHVMASLMRDDVGRGEFARAAGAAVEPRFDLAEESCVEKDFSVRRAIERPHRRLRHAATAAIGDVAEQHDLRPGVGLARRLEYLAPAVVDLTQNTGDHAAHFVGRRAGLARGRAVGLIGRRAAAAVEDFRAADQDARINPERVGDQAKHDDGSDAEPATAHRQPEAAATASAEHAAAVVTSVFDIATAAEIIVTHGGFPCVVLFCLVLLAVSRPPTTARMSIPLINNPPGKNCLVRLEAGHHPANILRSRQKLTNRALR